jgi:large subunit ribosomal protein L31
MLDSVPTSLFPSAMKTEIHPQYHTDTTVTCLCGNTFITGSTLAELKTEVCSVCHPFFTGTQRIIDTGGQVERFRRRAAAKSGKATAGAS